MVSVVEKPYGGLNVPDYPIFGVGQYHSWGWWLWYLSSSAMNSAAREGVFTTAPLGPRGGTHYAIASEQAWIEWVQKYKRNVQLRLNGEARRRLGYDGTRRSR